jgi:hypothetical protein
MLQRVPLDTMQDTQVVCAEVIPPKSSEVGVNLGRVHGIRTVQAASQVLFPYTTALPDDS